MIFTIDRDIGNAPTTWRCSLLKKMLENDRPAQEYLHKNGDKVIYLGRKD